MFLTYFFFALGFILLVKGASWLIEGAVVLAKRFHVSEITIGLTVVAFGTSAPELVVSVVSSIRASGELVMGNIIGSNIANIALVLGAAGLIVPLTINKGLVKKDIPFSLLGVIAVYFLATRTETTLILNRFAGGVLVVGFVLFLWLIHRSNKKPDDEIPKIKEEGIDLGMAGILTGGGLLTLALGGEFVVDSAIRIAEIFGVSQKLIGLTLVAVGTSLPELVTSVVAVWKKRVDLAIGNVIGSNVFNILWILGVSAIIRPVVFGKEAIVDLAILVGVTLLFLLAILIGKKYRVERWDSAVLLSGYAAYLAFVVWRG
ncbi:MAG: calcium/sodium antiporter [Patescibacteria group bacterium]